MQTHPRKKLEITVETAILPRVRALLAEAGVTGYTVIDAHHGAGTGGAWREDMISRAEQKHLVYAVTTDEACNRILDGLQTLFEHYSGIVAVSDVAVMRAGKF